jgi:ParB-like chromosome segregation protein Spo0J
MNIFSQELVKQIDDLIIQIESESIDEKIDFINTIKLSLHRISPLKKEPVDCVLWVRNETIAANDYNPNKVAPPEMELLKLSILEDGYTQPIVTFQEETHREVIDGFHRNRVGKEVGMIAKRIHGYLPVVTINMDRTDKADRIASTIRHNRARGKHAIDGMTDIVVDLKRRNWSDQKIAKELGMDADEILRLAQISGLAEMFTDKEFSQAWEAVETVIDDADNIFEEIKESN